MPNFADIVITPELLRHIVDIDTFAATWDGKAARLTPEELLGMKRVATIESVGSSNRIEGNRMTDEQVETLFSHINRHSFRSQTPKASAKPCNRWSEKATSTNLAPPKAAATHWHPKTSQTKHGLHPPRVLPSRWLRLCKSKREKRALLHRARAYARAHHKETPPSPSQRGGRRGSVF